MKHYYQLLEVAPTATKEEIKEAYKKLSKKFHPDKNGGNEFYTIRFISINEAYQVLNNDHSRRAYDTERRNYLLNLKNQYNMKRNPEIFYYSNRIHNKQLVFRGVLSVLIGLFTITILSFSFSERNNDNNRFSITKEGRENKTETTEEIKEFKAKTKAIYKSKIGIKSGIKTSLAESLIEKEKVDRNNSKIEKPSTKTFLKEFSDNEMNEIYDIVQTEKAKTNTKANCIKVIKSANSNVKNAFDVIRIFQLNGFVITGREVINKPVTGVKVDCSSTCITLTIGKR